jgi:hypothetical protein
MAFCKKKLAEAERKAEAQKVILEITTLEYLVCIAYFIDHAYYKN